MQEQPIRQPSAATNRPKPPAPKTPALPMTAPPLGPTPVDPLGVGDAGGAATEATPSKPSRLASALEGEQFRLPIECPHCHGLFKYKLRDGGATVECPHCSRDVILPPFEKDDVIIAQLYRLNDLMQKHPQLAEVNRKLNTLTTNVTVGVAIMLLAMFLMCSGYLSSR